MSKLPPGFSPLNEAYLLVIEDLEKEVEHWEPAVFTKAGLKAALLYLKVIKLLKNRNKRVLR